MTDCLTIEIDFRSIRMTSDLYGSSTELRVSHCNLGEVLYLFGLTWSEIDQIVSMNEIAGLALSCLDGWDGEIGAMPKSKAKIRAVFLLSHDSTNLDGMYQFENLEHASCQLSRSSNCDFGRFPHLRSASISWQKGFSSIFDVENLQDITVAKIPAQQVPKLADMQNLRRLGLISGQLSSLNEVSKLQNLTSLWLKDCKKLDSTAGVANFERLKCIDFTFLSCGIDVNAVAELADLQSLVIYECGVIESLRPLYGLNKLKRLIIFGRNCKINDVDLSDFENSRRWEKFVVKGYNRE